MMNYAFQIQTTQPQTIDLQTTQSSQTTSDAWCSLSTDDKLLQIMNGITNVNSSVRSFQDGFNSLVKKCSQLETEVRNNRDYILNLNSEINDVDKVASTAYNAVKVAELDLQRVNSTLLTADTQFFDRESVISGIPAHCQMSDREVAGRFLIAIGAEHLILHIIDVRELKSKNTSPANQEYYKLVIKFSSFQVRKDVMVYKRRRGKVIFKDLFPATITPQDSTKILYFNDLHPSDLYKRFSRIVQFFKLDRQIAIFCNEGQIFFRRNKEPEILVPPDFDLNSLNTL